MTFDVTAHVPDIASKRYHLGHFDTKEEAHAAYVAAAKAAQGDFYRG